MRVLSCNVWAGGVYCAAGSVPPPDVAALIGDHAWQEVPGSDAAEVTTARPAPPPDPTAVIPVVVEPVSATPEPAGTTEDVPPVAPDVVPANRGPEPAPKPLVDPATLTGPAPKPLVDPATLTEPPRAGRGSKRDSWVTYAAVLGLNTTDDMSRDDIVELVDAHLALTAQ